MPTVTVRQPASVRVKIGTSARPETVQTISYGTKTLRSLNDLGITGANTGDVIVYNAQTETFNVRPLGTSTPVTGNLLPSQHLEYDLGSPTQRFRSLYIGSNTIDLGGTILKTDANTGSLAIAAAPTDRYPNPVAILITPQGGFSPVQTVGGEIPVGALDATVSRSITYLAFTGADSGFF
jgi:hypothetical protein